MQKLPIDMSDIRKLKMKKLEKELQDYVVGFKEKELFECPFCHYQTKKKRFTASIFINKGNKIFFCHACKRWRNVNG